MARSALLAVTDRFGFLRDIKRLFSIVRREHKRWLVFLFCLMALQSLFQVAFVASLPLVVQALQNPETLQSAGIVRRAAALFGLDPTDYVGSAFAILGVAFVMTIAGATVITIARSAVLRRFVNDIGERLFAAYLGAPYVFHIQTNSAQLMRNLNQEVKRASNAFMSVLQFLMGAMTLTVLFVLLATQEPWVTLILLVAILTAALTLLLFLRRLSRRLGQKVRSQQGKLIQIINQAMAGIRDTRVLNREPEFFGQFSKTLRNFNDTHHKHKLVGAAVRPALMAAGVVMLVLVFTFLYLREGGVEPVLPIIALFAGAFMRILPAIRACVLSVSQLYFSSAAANSVADDLHNLLGADVLAPVEYSPPEFPITFEDKIEAHNVTFFYPDADVPAVRDISLSIKKGEMVGFVGASGSGKSTMVDILIGMLTPSWGQMTLDGIDIHQDLNGWRGMLGLVPQSVYLLDDTIRANVAYGLPKREVDDADVWRALEQANLDDVVRGLEKHLDTRIGENGVSLSGGERQRLGIARAIFTNPEILVLDESTSSLDNRTEKAIMSGVLEMKASRTIVMIAHRLSTVQHCDRIFFFQDGRVVAEGAYDELMASSQGFRAIANA